MAAINLHATAIVIGTRGLLFVGPSGSGKSTSALACLAGARAQGLFAALIADDQVMIAVVNGQVLATRPATIAGLAEIRGGGIVSVPSLPAAVIDQAILPVQTPFQERLPPEGEVFHLPDGTGLPLTRLPLAHGFAAYDVLRFLLPGEADLQAW